jgi:hypothetical protein
MRRTAGPQRHRAATKELFMQANRTTQETWAATNIMTQMSTRIAGQEAFLGRDDRELGTPVGQNAFELFTICPPGEALKLYFERAQPTFIAVHDIGLGSSGLFLAELATALRQPMQTLTFRQQGSGTMLGTLRFIELPSKGTPVRVFATSIDGDASTRRHVAESLLAFSRLGVLLVDALPESVLATHMKALRDRMLSVPWNNRELLLIPRTPMPNLPGQAQYLVDGSLVHAVTAPHASQTAPIWRAVHGAWSRLRSGAPEAAPASSMQAPATPIGASMPQAAPVAAMKPMPSIAPRVAVPTALAQEPVSLLSPGNHAPITFRQMEAPLGTPADAPRGGCAAYALACAGLRGALGCIVFDRVSRKPLAKAVRSLDASGWVEQGTAMLEAALALGEQLGEPQPDNDCVATLYQHVVMARIPPRHTEWGVIIVFDKVQANLALLRAQLQRLDPMLDHAAA